jgi:polyferredoxin
MVLYIGTAVFYRFFAIPLYFSVSAIWSAGFEYWSVYSIGRWWVYWWLGILVADFLGKVLR